MKHKLHPSFKILLAFSLRWAPAGLILPRLILFRPALFGLAVFGLTLLGLEGCSATKGGGGSVVEPEESEPYIIEALLCSDVTQDNKPVGVSDIFAVGSRIYLWVDWANIKGLHSVEVYWFDPNGDQQFHDRREFDSQTDRQITYFYIETTYSAPQGWWLVEIFLDGKFMRSLAFELVG